MAGRGEERGRSCRYGQAIAGAEPPLDIIRPGYPPIARAFIRVAVLPAKGAEAPAVKHGDVGGPNPGGQWTRPDWCGLSRLKVGMVTSKASPVALTTM